MLRLRNVVFGTGVVSLAAVGIASAQIVITDPAVTLRDQIIATLKNQILTTLTQQADQLHKMAKRLSALTNLDKYTISHDDTPRWRNHPFQFEKFLYANAYNAALNSGDGNGASYEDVARARTAPGAELTALVDVAPGAEAAIVAGLATLDAADSSIIAGTDQTGQLRHNGRRELAAIEALQEDAVDPSPNQSATAIVDKISGSGLIRARQQQARIQFLGAIVEQLLVDNKRSRDTEAATMNMQLERLRWGQTANRSLVAGAGDDLRTWRQP